MKKPADPRISISQAVVLPQDQAKAALDTLRQLRAQIDGLEIPTPAALKRLRGTAIVPTDFLEQVAIVLDESQPVATATAVNGEDVRNAVALVSAWTAVEEELTGLASGVAGMITRLKSGLGSDALRVYSHVKSFARNKENDHLKPHLEALAKRLNRGTRRRPKPPANTPAT